MRFCPNLQQIRSFGCALETYPLPAAKSLSEVVVSN